MAKVGIYPVEFTASIRLFLVTKTEVTIDTFALGLRFNAGTTYTVELEEGFVKETGANKFDSPAVSSLSQFTTNITGPQVQSDTPSGNNVTNNTSITYTYDRQLLAGNGNFYLYRETGSPDEEVAVFNPSDSTGSTTISGNQITLDVTGLIRAGETYYTLIDEGAVEDKDGLPAFGFDNDQEHRWTTAPSTGDFPDLSAVLTDAFAPSIAANITVNPFTDMSVTATMTATANVTKDVEADLFTQITTFVARPNFTWNNAHSMSAVVSVSTIANFTTTNNPAPLSTELNVGTPWYEAQFTVRENDLISFFVTPDATKHIKVLRNPTNQYQYQFKLYDNLTNNLLNTIPNSGYFNQGTTAHYFGVDNNAIYRTIDAIPQTTNNVITSWTAGVIQKIPFDYTGNQSLEYISDPDYDGDNADREYPGGPFTGYQAAWGDPFVQSDSNLVVMDYKAQNFNRKILYNIDTSDMSLTSTFVLPTISASSISGLDRDVDSGDWYVADINSKTIIVADFVTSDLSGTTDQTKTFIKIYNGNNFVRDITIPTGFYVLNTTDHYKINSSYAAILMYQTSNNNQSIKIYNLATGTLVRSIDPYSFGDGQQGCYLKKLDRNNNLALVRNYGYANNRSQVSGSNPIIYNNPEEVTEVINVQTGDLVSEFGLPGVIQQPYNQYIDNINDGVYSDEGRYLQVSASNNIYNTFFKKQ